MDFSRRRILQLSAAGTLSGCATGKMAGNFDNLPRGGFYQDVDDIRMYCEVRGSGPLLILQTGVWLRHVATPENETFSALSEYFTVLTFDGRGQGKTTLGAGPANYGRFAADTVRLMDALKIDSAHFFGHSDGGCIELELLLNFGDRVKSATLGGTPYNHKDSYRPFLQEAFDLWYREMKVDSDRFYGLDGQLVSEQVLEEGRKAYAKHSPHPEKFLQVLKENRRCWSTEPDISQRRLAAIRRPVLVLCAGADEYMPREAMETLADSIPNARRLPLPDTTHNLGPHINEIARAMREFTSHVDAEISA